MMRPALAAMGLSSQCGTRATTISLITTAKPHEVDCNHAITALVVFVVVTANPQAQKHPQRKQGH